MESPNIEMRVGAGAAVVDGAAAVVATVVAAVEAVALVATGLLVTVGMLVTGPVDTGAEPVGGVEPAAGAEDAVSIAVSSAGAVPTVELADGVAMSPANGTAGRIPPKLAAVDCCRPPAMTMAASTMQPIVVTSGMAKRRARPHPNRARRRIGCSRRW